MKGAVCALAAAECGVVMFGSLPLARPAAKRPGFVDVTGQSRTRGEKK